MVKRVATLFFLSILMLQVAGCYLYFIVRLSAIRTEKRAELKLLPDSALTVLKLTPAEFRQARVEEHEVKVAGKMYDIARVQHQHDVVYVYGMHDEAEDNLLSFLHELVKRSANDKKPIPGQLVSLLSLEFLPEINSLPVNCCCTITHHSAYLKELISVCPANETPPPRLILPSTNFLL